MTSFFTCKKTKIRLRAMGDETPPLYPGFEEDARLWGLQTSAGERCVHRTGRASVAFTAPRRGCMPLPLCVSRVRCWTDAARGSASRSPVHAAQASASAWCSDGQRASRNRHTWSAPMVSRARAPPPACRARCADLSPAPCLAFRVLGLGFSA